MSGYRHIKRGLDVIVSGALLAVTSPLMLVVGALIKRHDGGDVLYRATRVGRDGDEFTMFKFRTMVVDAELLGGSSTASNDARITPVGRWLRDHKLDELPQLLNVLRGDMSLVGPRPQVGLGRRSVHARSNDAFSVSPRESPTGHRSSSATRARSWRVSRTLTRPMTG